MATVTEPNTPINPMVLTIARYVLTGIGSVLVNKGILDNDTMLTFVSAIMTIGMTGLGAYLAYRNAKVLKAAAPYTPNNIIESK